MIKHLLSGPYVSLAIIFKVIDKLTSKVNKLQLYQLYTVKYTSSALEIQENFGDLLFNLNMAVEY